MSEANNDDAAQTNEFTTDDVEWSRLFVERLNHEQGDVYDADLLESAVRAHVDDEDRLTDEIVTQAVDEGLLDRVDDGTVTPTARVLGDPGHAVEPDETVRGNGEKTPNGTGSSGENTDVECARPSGRSFYPDELLARNWWVNWVLAYRHDAVDDDGTAEEDATATKQPVAPYRRSDAEPVRWNFGLSDEEHPSTTFKTVEQWDGEKVGLDVPAPDRVISDEIGVGIIIPTEQDGEKITLLDWDDVRDPETGEVHPVAGAAIDEIDGYAEISQSGEGIHQFVFGEIPGGLKKFIRHVDDEPFVGDDLPQIEMYESGRLCAMTARHVAGSGEDVVEGQDLIDELCWEFGTAGNNSTETPTDPFAHERDDGGEVPDHETVDRAMREAREYNGDAVGHWDIPEGRSLEYEAVIRARERSDELNGVANWKLNSFAGALGFYDGLSHDEVVEDLDAVCNDGSARRESGQAHRKASNGNYPRPSREMLVRRGILPEDVLGGEPEDAVPTFDVNGGGQLILEPIDGSDCRVRVKDGDGGMYTEVVEKGAWQTRGTRENIASAAADAVNVEAGAVRGAFVDALAEAEEDPERWKKLMRDETTADLLDRTEEVIVYPAADNTKWIVRMRAGETDRAEGIETFEFGPGAFDNGNPAPFTQAYLGRFLTEVDLDAEGWNELTSEWIDDAEVKETETDVGRDVLVEDLLRDLGTAGAFDVVHEDDKTELFDPTTRRAVYVENDDGPDEVMVPARYITEKVEESNTDLTPSQLSQELRDRGIMTRSTTRIRDATGGRSSVWAFDADQTGWDRGGPFYRPAEDEDEGAVDV